LNWLTVFAFINSETFPCSKQYWRDVGPILHAILANIGCQYWPNITMWTLFYITPTLAISRILANMRQYSRYCTNVAPILFATRVGHLSLTLLKYSGILAEIEEQWSIFSRKSATGLSLKRCKRTSGVVCGSNIGGAGSCNFSTDSYKFLT